MYSLRDVTATVESLPLICASIMSKKLAEGIDGLVLDVKFGSGAFMKTLEQAEQLARALVGLARDHGRKASALLTSMQQPLGRYAGNSLEVWECIEIMTPSNKALDRMSFETRELSLKLSAHMLALSGRFNLDSGYKAAQEALSSGRALSVWQELCRRQGGNLEKLPERKPLFTVNSPRSGFVKDMQTEALGMICVRLGAGRRQVSDIIEPTAGLEFHKKIGDHVQVSDPLFTVFSAQKDLPLREIEALLIATVTLTDGPVEPIELIKKEIS